MWVYSQTSGELLHDDERVAFGYAGSPVGKNRPDMQEVHNVGPLPRGIYTFNPPVDTMTHGPYVLWLTPDPANEMFGRGSFGMHGDSKVDPGGASEGCIVMARNIREQVWNSGDTKLQVVI